MLEKELEIAINLARTAGKRVLEFYKAGFEIEEKIGADDFREPVTNADREASRIIVEGIAEHFPSDGILSEEEIDHIDERLSKRRVWIIDPIDGTAGFVNHDGDFAIQIGLAEEGIPILGVVMLPFHDTINYAVKGQGAFSQSGADGPQRVHVSDAEDLASLGIAVSRNHPSSRMQQIIKHFGFRNTIRRGSVGLKVSLIASRAADVYIHPSPRTKLWDTCSPQIILEEAGGKMTDLFGFPITYNTPDVHNRDGIVASNGKAHRAIIDHLAPLLAEFGRVPHRA